MKLFIYTSSALVVMDFLSKLKAMWVTQLFDLRLCCLSHVIANIVTDFLYHSSKEPATLGMITFSNDHLKIFLYHSSKEPATLGMITFSNDHLKIFLYHSSKEPATLGMMTFSNDHLKIFLYHSSKEPATLGMMTFSNDHLKIIWISGTLFVLNEPRTVDSV